MIHSSGAVPKSLPVPEKQGIKGEIALSERVFSVNSTICVSSVNGVPGSLKPMCPFAPIPKT